MKKAVIQSGNFTEAGNFSGYADGIGRVFIHGKQMEATGWKKNEDVKYPFYATIGTKTINPFDEDGKPMTNEDGSLKEVERVQALSVFTTREKLVSALAEPQLIDLEVTKLVKSQASSAGLTQKEVEALLANVI